MDIKHSISVNSTESDFLRAIINMGVVYNMIKLPGTGGNLITILISELDPFWNSVVILVQTQKRFEVYGEGDMFETYFSEVEIRAAEWLRLVPSFEQGYPQPRAHWPIKQLSFELLCINCAIYNQTESMRLVKEPHLGKKTFMSFITTAEIFARPAFFQALEDIQAMGYEAKKVLIHKTGTPSEVVSQLYVNNVAEPGLLDQNKLDNVICPVCGTIKYFAHMNGVMKYKKESLRADVDFIRTHEWFGSGYIAWREILVSNRIARLILDNKWEGVRLKVIELK
jgi:hypothetical protein